MEPNALSDSLRNGGRSTLRAARARGSATVRQLATVVALAVTLGASTLAAQDVASSGGQRATRAQLADRVAELERQLAGNARGVDRNRAMAEIAGIKRRLEEGDFPVGTQFVLTLTTAEQVRADTVSVRDSLLVAIATQVGTLPDASVRGVLRSELNERLSAHVARYLRNAQVRVNVLTRITILGAVGRPGIYSVSPDRPVGELIMLAGGPTPDAKLDELEISRSGRKVLSSKDSKRALKEGRTLDQLDVQSGDDVSVPKKKHINWSAILQIFAIATTLLFAVIQFIQFYYSRKD
jgi:protein involved in polysaccharide export with SLBB domain